MIYGYITNSALHGVNATRDKHMSGTDRGKNLDFSQSLSLIGSLHLSLIRPVDYLLLSHGKGSRQQLM